MTSATFSPPASYNTEVQLAHLESFYKNGSSTLTAIIGTRLAVIDIAARAFCDFARFLADAVQVACHMSLKPCGNRIRQSLGEAIGSLAFAVYAITMGMLFPSAVVRFLDRVFAAQSTLHKVREAAETVFATACAVALLGGLMYGIYRWVALLDKRELEFIQKCRAAEADPKILTDREWLRYKQLVCPQPYRFHR